MTRFRLVTRTTAGGKSEEHVSSVILGADEIDSHLATEAVMHQMAGWAVSTDGIEIVCSRPDKTRTIFARETDPFHDEIT